MTSERLLALLLFFASALVISVDSYCPDEEEINPCTCEEESGKTVLRCKNIPNVAVLERAAKNSDGYKYDEIHIEASTLQYIPKVVPETIRTDYLALRNLTLIRLVDSIPNTLDELKSVVLQDIKPSSGVSWEVFKNTKGIESLIVDKVSVPILKEEFNEYMTHNLKKLFLQYSDTKEIRKGAFEGFDSLQTLSLTNNKLQGLQRDSFPQPCNIELLFLQSNQLTVIPEDFFLGWPKLQTLMLNGNLISRFYEPAVNSFIPNVLDVSDNPLKCDCYMKWIVEKHQSNIQGTCGAPKQLSGKSLQDLKDEDFDC